MTSLRAADRSAIRARIQALNESGKSYRQLAEEAGVKFGTLQRIVKDNYFPKEKRIVGALVKHFGEQKQELPSAPSPEWWERVEKKAMNVMVKNTRKAVIRRNR